MARTRIIYVGIATVFLASGATYTLLPHGELIQQVAGIPLVGSLIVALVQILRDQAAHERAVLLQDLQNRFALGASSHMANVAFDKHVEFCEEYVAEVHRVLRTLIREGPTEEALTHTAKLYETQQKFAVWLTPQMEADLETFERALREVGATAGMLKSAGHLDDRQQHIAKLYKVFADVLGSRWFPNGWKGEQLTEGPAITMVIQRLRTILGIEELTAMRSSLLSKAHGLGATDG